MRTIPLISTATDAPQEHVVLCRAYGAVQERCSRIMGQQQAEIGRLQAEVVRLRAAVIVRDTALALERESFAQQQQEAYALAHRSAAPAALPPKAHMRARQWLQLWWHPSVTAAEPAPSASGVGQSRARLATAELLGCQGSWLSPGVDWPG